MAATLKPILPPFDGNSRLRITSVIRSGDPAPTIYFAGTIAPESVTAMVLNSPPGRKEVLVAVSAHLMQQLNDFCDTALGPPKEAP